MSQHPKLHGRYDPALRVTICSDEAYMVAVVWNLATAMANATDHTSTRLAMEQIGDVIVVPTGHDTYKRIAGCVVKIGALETRLDTLEEAKALVSEVRAAEHDKCWLPLPDAAEGQFIEGHTA